MNDLTNAHTWLKKAEETNDIDLIWKNVDPLLKSLREYKPAVAEKSVQEPDYATAELLVLTRLQNELPETLHYHNIVHTRDVVATAVRIAQHEGINEYEQKLLKTAALYHDVGFVVSPKNHEDNGCEIVRSTLPTLGFDGQQIDLICNMIMATRIPQSPQTQLEKILCDADLDYLGRDDFFVTGRSLYNEMKERGFVETEREWNLIQKTFLESHRYHTRFSKENREQKKLQHLQEIIEKLQPR
jgi:HD superfamily phosphodiesterase